MGRTLKTTEDLKRKYPTATIVKNWDELKKFEGKSETHELKIEKTGYAGQLICLGEREYNPKKWWWSQIKTINHYLSTHTFDKAVYMTKILQICGFNVIIYDWSEKR